MFFEMRHCSRREANRWWRHQGKIQGSMHLLGTIIQRGGWEGSIPIPEGRGGEWCTTWVSTGNSGRCRQNIMTQEIVLLPTPLNLQEMRNYDIR